MLTNTFNYFPNIILLINLKNCIKHLKKASNQFLIY